MKKTKNSNKKRGIAAFFKNCGLLLRCLFATVSYATLWVGIVLHGQLLGVVLIIIGVLATLLSIFANIIVPVSRLK